MSGDERPVEIAMELAVDPADSLAAAARVADSVGASWTPQAAGGRLELPVSAGLRYGLLAGRLEAHPTTGGSRLVLTVESVEYRIHRSALVVLLIGALGTLPVILWPFQPHLLALTPFGLVLAFIAWFVVASRLRTAGAEEFLEAVRKELPGNADPPAA